MNEKNKLNNNFKDLYKQDNAMLKPDSDFVEGLISRLQEESDKQKQRRKRRLFTAVPAAAAVLLVIIGGIFVFSQGDGGISNFKQVRSNDMASPEAAYDYQYELEDANNSNEVIYNNAQGDAENGDSGFYNGDGDYDSQKTYDNDDDNLDEDNLDDIENIEKDDSDENILNKKDNNKDITDSRNNDNPGSNDNNMNEGIAAVQREMQDMITGGGYDGYGSGLGIIYRIIETIYNAIYGEGVPHD